MPENIEARRARQRRYGKAKRLRAKLSREHGGSPVVVCPHGYYVVLGAPADGRRAWHGASAS
jgi:hypothetical protein